MLLQDLLFNAEQQWPDKLAAVFPENEITFSGLARQSLAVAGYMRARGIGTGARVAILSDNCLDALVYFWGVIISGAVPVDIPSLAGDDTIEAALEESQCQVLVVHPQQLKKMLAKGWPIWPELLFSFGDVEDIEKKLLNTGRPLFMLQQILNLEADTAPYPRNAGSDVAMIIYTSGTTGRPKGIMLSHAGLLFNAMAFNSKAGLTDKDSLLLVVPLYYIHGRIQLITHTMVGGTLFFSVGFHFPQAVIAELIKYGPTGISGVPYHFTTLLRFGKLAQIDLSRLKNVTITGGALPATSLRELQNALSNTEIHLNYGLTEASPRLTYHGPSSEIFLRPESCGKALPGVTIEILNEEGVQVPPGTVGEIVASTPGIMKGYVSGDEYSSGAIDEMGRLRTGDLGYLDEQGYLFLCGRSSEMIKTAGERVFPQEIEAVLQRHSGICETAVLGVPDPTLGERLTAYVVPHKNYELNLSEIRKHCLKFLPYVRVPKTVTFLDDLPKTPSGKIKRNALRLLHESSARSGGISVKKEGT